MRKALRQFRKNACGRAPGAVERAQPRVATLMRQIMQLLRALLASEASAGQTASEEPADGEPPGSDRQIPLLWRRTALLETAVRDMDRAPGN